MIVQIYFTSAYYYWFLWYTMCSCHNKLFGNDSSTTFVIYGVCFFVKISQSSLLKIINFKTIMHRIEYFILNYHPWKLFWFCFRWWPNDKIIRSFRCIFLACFFDGTNTLTFHWRRKRVCLTFVKFSCIKQINNLLIIFVWIDTIYSNLINWIDQFQFLKKKKYIRLVSA